MVQVVDIKPLTWTQLDSVTRAIQRNLTTTIRLYASNLSLSNGKLIQVGLLVADLNQGTLTRGMLKCIAPIISSTAGRCIRHLASVSNNNLPEGFLFLPQFFDIREQRLLLTTALAQLDALETRRIRKLQQEYRTKNPISVDAPVDDAFFPDHSYTFHDGHYDNVIRSYREMRLSSWPETEVQGLSPLLNRLRALCPSSDTQTHLLHLSSSGEILPHIDNTDASGVWILGVSLGATRTLRMESVKSSEPERFDIELPSGSVYLQRDNLRYHWQHSVLLPSGLDKAKRGQRLSIMIRDLGG